MTKPRLAAGGMRKILVIALAATLATALAACAPPMLAHAEQAAKSAIPTVDKTVSTGGAYAKEASASAGAPVAYRLKSTMPEDLDLRKELVYRVIDNPDDGITVDWSTISAHVESADGTHKASVQASPAADGDAMGIMLGDLKAACPNLQFGDYLVIDYRGSVSPSAKAGDHRNIAHLEYRTGDKWQSTVEVEAIVKVPVTGPASGGNAGTFGKTGDYLARFWPIAVVAAAALALAGIALRRSAKWRADASDDWPVSFTGFDD